MFYTTKTEKAEMEDTDEIIFVKEEDGHIDISQLIYETIILSIPSKIEHKLDENGNKTCNSKKC